MSEKKPEKGQVLIRALEPADVDALCRMWQAESIYSQTLVLPYRSAASARDIFLGSDAGTHHLVAALDGVVVGHIGLNILQRERRRHVAWLGMMVDEKYQRRGIGKKLLEAALVLGEKWCGVLRFELEVFVDNTRAIQLYANHGFVVEGIERAHALRDGALVDCFRMARVASVLPYRRITAEDAANRPVPQLPKPREEKPPPAPPKKKRGPLN